MYGRDEDAKPASMVEGSPLPQCTREEFVDAVKMLKESFEPKSKRELYMAEFQVPRKER